MIFFPLKTSQMLQIDNAAETSDNIFTHPLIKHFFRLQVSSRTSPPRNSTRHYLNHSRSGLFNAGNEQIV